MSSNETRTKQNSPEPGTWQGTGQHTAGPDGAPCTATMGTEGQSWGCAASWAPLSSYVLRARWALGSAARRAAIPPRSILRNSNSACLLRAAELKDTTILVEPNISAWNCHLRWCWLRGGGGWGKKGQICFQLSSISFCT